MTAAPIRYTIEAGIAHAKERAVRVRDRCAVYLGSRDGTEVVYVRVAAAAPPEEARLLGIAEIDGRYIPAGRTEPA